MSIARADVDMTGKLEKVSSLKTVPSGVQPLATSQNGDYRCADEYSVIGNKPYYFAIGNCREGWTLEAVALASENTKTHEHSYGGYIGSSYSYCGWIDTRFPIEKFNDNNNSACTNGPNNATEIEDSSFMEKYDENNTEHDGTYVVNPLPCPEYANYRPWSTNNVEKELIRTAPAYAAVVPGSRTPALKWRYTTKYSSTDGTGQYVMVRDTRITGGGEGNWVFVKRSCLSSPLPANEGEAINPPAPTATTSGFNSVTATSANLTGSVNPNGVETHYYIEWGREPAKPDEGFAPTPYPGEDIGSGTKEVPESVTATGLKPGTLYYYRIVAQSPAGMSKGGVESFTTLSPPATTTEGASEVKERTAKLNGHVNPNGLATHYYFEYGPTTSYGSTVPASPGMEIGEGTGAVYTWNIAGKLTPGAEYHYRVVATNSAGTSYGVDEAFKTLPTPNEQSTWAVSDPYTNEEWLYYVGSGSAVWEWWFNGTKYESIKVGGEVSPGTTPAVLRDEETGQQWVYYVGKNEDAIWQFYWNGTKWESSKVGGQVAAGSSLATVLDPTTGYPSLYYIGATNHIIWQFYWNGTAYGSAEIGGEAAPNTSPAIDRDPEHNGAVYIVGKDNAIWQFYWNGKAWASYRIGGEVASNTSPAVAYSAAESTDSVYYVGRNESAIWQWYWNGTSWVAVKVGGTLAPNTGVAVAYDPGAGGGLYVVGTEDDIWQFYWNGTAWAYDRIGGQVATGTPLGVLRDPLTGDESLYYVGLNEGAVWKFYWNGTSWISVEP
ncbi:MAG TPA: hypothetical protein VK778_12600 [Solirubrobacteraceae bacterium]|nr:hypothetical protein [Solirubrobacteraceae bacterium]